MSEKVKVMVQMDIDDIPDLIGHKLVLGERYLKNVEATFHKINTYCDVGDYINTLKYIKTARENIANVDQHLDDCSAIVSGYLQTVAAEHMPQQNEEPSNLEALREVLRNADTKEQKEESENDDGISNN